MVVARLKSKLGPAWVWLSMHMLPQNTNSQLFSRREKKLSVSPRRKRICWILNWPTQYKMNLWKRLRKMKNMKNKGFWAFQLQHGWKKLTTVAGRRVSRFPCFSWLSPRDLKTHKLVYKFVAMLTSTWMCFSWSLLYSDLPCMFWFAAQVRICRFRWIRSDHSGHVLAHGKREISVVPHLQKLWVETVLYSTWFNMIQW